MKILITGGTGLIGSHLCVQLHQLGHELTVLSRKPETVPTFCKTIRSLDEWQPATHFDAVINLAGESIVDKAWTEARKKVLWDSRVGLTQSLVRCIEAADEKPSVFISGSAIGYYGNTGDKTLDEGAHVGKDFGAQLCDEWEKAALASSVRVCVLRTGLVLAPSGGFLKKMLPAFKLGLGGSMGSGTQWMSWIHIEDLVQMYIFALEGKNVEGVLNGVAPEAVQNKEFTKALSKAKEGSHPSVTKFLLSNTGIFGLNVYFTSTKL
jgi:uncharacterized protein (TIGR01777 family)